MNSRDFRASTTITSPLTPHIGIVGAKRCGGLVHDSAQIVAASKNSRSDGIGRGPAGGNAEGNTCTARIGLYACTSLDRTKMLIRVEPYQSRSRHCQHFVHDPGSVDHNTAK